MFSNWDIFMNQQLPSDSESNLIFNIVNRRASFQNAIDKLQLEYTNWQQFVYKDRVFFANAELFTLLHITKNTVVFDINGFPLNLSKSDIKNFTILATDTYVSATKRYSEQYDKLVDEFNIGAFEKTLQEFLDAP